MQAKLLKLSVLLLLLSNLSCNTSNNEAAKKTPNYPTPQTDFNPRAYICYKTSEQLTIDGVLDEKSWKNAKWSEDFVDIEGKTKALHQTRFKMLWDNDYLYIAAELKEPHINATLRQRDTVIFYDNDFEVFIDPDGDTHNYFEFEMNAFNTVWDLFITQPYRERNVLVIDAWNILGLKSAVKLYGTINNPSDTDDKWTVELAFPMQVLTEGGRDIPKDKDQWRINFSRVQWQYDIVNGTYKKKINKKTGKTLPEYNWVWSPQGLINMHYPEMWGFVQFSDFKPNTNNIEFVMPKDELLKWELRKVYYAQKKYFKKFKKYSASLNELQKYGYKNKAAYKIEIQLTKSDYEAVIQSNDKTWSINSSGRTFKSFVAP